MIRRASKLAFAMFALTVGLAGAAHASTNTLVIEPAAASGESHLGFGWSSQSENADGRDFRWINHLEADTWFDLAAAADTAIVFTAAPLYINWRRQVIGVYVNGRFVTEWICPDQPDFQDYRVAVPAALLKPGRNCLTLRAAYRRRIPPDSRELALGVSRILIQSR